MQYVLYDNKTGKILGIHEKKLQEYIDQYIEVTDINAEYMLVNLDAWRVNLVTRRLVMLSKINYKQQKIQKIKLARDLLLNSTDWLVIRHHDEKDLDGNCTLSESAYNDLLQYRESLRNFITDDIDIDNIPWPQIPSSIESYLPEIDYSKLL